MNPLPASPRPAEPPERAPAPPRLLRPMLPTVIPEPFDSDDHIFELKWGGVRVLAFLEEGRLRLQGRNLRDVTDWYPELHSLPSQLRARSAVLDGEVVALGRSGYPDLEALRQRFTWHGTAPRRRAAEAAIFSYQVYDILIVEGRPLMDRPLWQRKNILHTVLEPGAAAQACDFIDRDGIAFYEAVADRGLEGVVAKSRYGRYFPGQRTREWLEVRAQQSGEFVIGGYAFAGKRPFDALLLGLYEGGGRLRYVGRVDGPFPEGEARRILEQLSPRHSRLCPFSDPPEVRRLVHWLRPELVCQVRFGQWTQGRLRFPVFVTLRPDLEPADCATEPA